MSFNITPIADFEDLSYAEYQSWGGVLIALEDWPTRRAAALRTVHDVTLRRTLTGTGYDAEIRDAICRAAEIHHHIDPRAVTAESIGSYSASYADPQTEDDARRVAINALSTTGLTYRGI